MAEESYLWDNPGTGDSPALGYGHTEFMTEMFRMIFNGTGDQGVLLGWLNDLEVTDGGVDTATVDTGAAITYGFWYENDAALNVNIAAYRGGNCLIVVRAVWATQTIRIVARAVGALTQTAGVTYEIPLANVAINGAGAITLVTDTRDYCEFSTVMFQGLVNTDAIQADAVTTGKLLNQTRWLTRAAGALEPDGTNPAAWTSHTTTTPYHDIWDFADAVTDAVWIAFRVPADFSGGNVTVKLKTQKESTASGDVRWTYSIFDAQPSAVLVNTTGAAVQTLTATSDWEYYREHTLCAVALTAGDIVHMQIARDGAHAADTLTATVSILEVRVEYTADS